MKLDKRKTIAIVGGAAVLSIIIFIIVRRNKNKKTIEEINKILDGTAKDPNAQSGGQTIIPKSVYDALPEGRFPLKFGQKNKKVYELQRLLNTKYGLSIDLDGKFGQSTASALCKNYFIGCFFDVQSRLYEVNENDFKELRKSKN